MDQLNADKSDAERQVKRLKAQRQRELAAALAAAGRGGGGPSIGGVFKICPVDQPPLFVDHFGMVDQPPERLALSDVRAYRG